MDSALYELIRDVKAKELADDGFGANNSSFTHKTFFGPNASWTVDKENYTKLWSLYCEMVYKGKGNYCFGERVEENMPITVEATLTFNDTGETEFYEQDFFMAFVQCIQDTLLELLDINGNHLSAKEMIAIIMESTSTYISPIDQKNVCRSFRIQFPYCCVNTEFYQQKIRPRLIQLLRTKKVISKIKEQPLFDWDHEKCPIIYQIKKRDAVPMYRSNREVDQPKMEVKHIFGRLTNENVNDKDYESLEPSTIFPIQAHCDIENNIISKTIFEDNGDDFDYWLPLILSMRYWSKLTHPKRVPSSSSRVTSLSTNRAALDLGDEDSFGIAVRLLGYLNEDRFKNEVLLTDIGKALHTTCEGDNRGLDVWIAAIKKNNGIFSEEECRLKYLDFDKQNFLSERTIAWYAKIDKPAKYTRWHNEWKRTSFVKALSSHHNDVSKALYKCYWLEFACASLKNDWYQYKNHKWFKCDQGVALKRKISNEFIKSFEKYRTDLSTLVQQATTDMERSTCEMDIKKVTKLIGRLKDYSFKTNLVKDVMEHFYIENFQNMLDSNPDIMGHKNCVFEATDKKIHIRPGKPEDYITKNSNCSYPMHFNANHPTVVECNKYLKQVFVDAELRHHFLKLASAIFRGKNSNKIFQIWSGMGDNSKSIIVKMFQAILGEYCVKLPTSFITVKQKSSGQPAPEIARSKAARLLIAEEPENDDVLTVGLIKRLTGGDSFFARFLNDNGGEIEPFFKLVLMCNKIPAIPSPEKAIKNRLSVLPFFSTWVVDGVPATEEEQYKQKIFKQNPFFEKQIPVLAPAFLWILTNYYEIYMKEGLKNPKCVNDETKKYWDENDMYQTFVDESITRPIVPNTVGINGNGEIDMTQCLLISEIYDEFKKWFKDCYPGVKIPPQPVVKMEISNKLDKAKNRRWYGYKIVEKNAGTMRPQTLI
jgi:phage/plasmid-associated DNA primase